MTNLAILLVLSSALTHALWNFLAKRAIGGIAFIWLFGLLEVIYYVPVFLFLIYHENIVISGIDLIMIVGSAIIHLVYFVTLIRGYRVADLSIVYPFSRGIGPLLSAIAAIIIFSERPTPLAFVGTLLIAVGIIGLTGDPRKFRKDNLLKGLLYASLTGLSIATYTIWDTYAVSTVGISPLIFQWGVTSIRLLILTPVVLRQWGQVKMSWTEDKWKAGGVAILSSLSYVLMLFALSFSPVSYVAPLRSISILMGVLMGAYLLKEGNVQKRLGATSVMVLGAIALGMG
jgi:drug/metabolite transporter (DMT)-like permease